LIQRVTNSVISMTYATKSTETPIIQDVIRNAVIDSSKVLELVVILNSSPIVLSAKLLQDLTLCSLMSPTMKLIIDQNQFGNVLRIWTVWLLLERRWKPHMPLELSRML
jgi:hypothetical protein